MTGSLENGGARSSERASAVYGVETIISRLIRLPKLRNLRPLLGKILAVMRPLKEMRISHFPRVSFPQNSQNITVMSANLWHDWPRRRRLSDRLEAFAQLVEKEGVDVVLLQEVIRSPQFCADDWLADRLGMAHVYTRANGDESAIGFEEGLAVLSRFPILSSQRRSLDLRMGFSHRMALAAEVISPLGKLLAVSVHLGLLRRRNQRQWSDLRSWVTDMAGGRTTLIGGDFNAHEDALPIREAQEQWIDTYRIINPVEEGTTHELRLPWGKSFRRRRLDYIFLQPGPTYWAVQDAKHLRTPQEAHSDHHAVLAKLSPTQNS